MLLLNCCNFCPGHNMPIARSTGYFPNCQLNWKQINRWTRMCDGQRRPDVEESESLDRHAWQLKLFCSQKVIFNIMWFILHIWFFLMVLFHIILNKPYHLPVMKSTTVTTKINQSSVCPSQTMAWVDAINWILTGLRESSCVCSWYHKDVRKCRWITLFSHSHMCFSILNTQ